MAYGEPPEKYVLRINLAKITEVVELNLDVIGGCLAQEAFMTQRQVNNTIGTLGPTPTAKANTFMRNIDSKLDTSDKREKWFEKFVHILAKNTTEGELVNKLISDFVEKKPDYRGSLLSYIGTSQGRKGDVSPDSPTQVATSGASVVPPEFTPKSQTAFADPSGQMGKISSDSPASATGNLLGESDEDRCNKLECEKKNFAKGFWELEYVDEPNGDGIIIAILDSGIQASHRAFEDKILKEYSRNFCSRTSGDHNVDDRYGHGTRCAGIAAGLPFEYVAPPCTSDKFTYLGGVAPGAKLVICKVTDDKSPSLQAVEDALQYICELQTAHRLHVHVVSMSLGFRCSPPKSLQKKIFDLAHQGTICVASAGNHGSEYARPVLCPASCPYAIAVGSHNKRGNPSTFYSKGSKIHCLTLGEGVCAPTIDTKSQPANEALTCCNGTSEAAPAVAGLVALIIQSMIKIGELKADEADKLNFDTILRVLEGMAMKSNNKLLRPKEFFDGVNPQYFKTYTR